MFDTLRTVLFQGRRRRARGTARTYRPRVQGLEQRALMSAGLVGPQPLVQTAPNAGSALMGVMDLQVTYPDNTTVVGSGAMIDRLHVLTAAHLLYSAKDGGYAKFIEAIPAANDMGNPVGFAYGTYERVDPSCVNFNASHPGATSPTVVDVGLVTLDRPIGDSTGWFKLGYNNLNRFFKGAIFDTAGYPGAGAQLFVSAGAALGVVSKDGLEFTQSSMPAVPGQSGSPIYQVTAHGTPVIYGVLTGANGYSSSSDVYAARITPAVYQELVTWENADRRSPVKITLPVIEQPMPEPPIEFTLPIVGHPISKGPVHYLPLANGAPAIEALSWWDPMSNIFGNINCVVNNMWNWNWGSNYYPQTWQQVVAPPPSSCIYVNPADSSSYNDYYSNDYYFANYSYDDYSYYD